MKRRLTIFLIATFFLMSALKAGEPAKGDDGKDETLPTYSQVKAEFGITHWDLSNAGFLQAEQGFTAPSAGISFITNFPINSQWTGVMGWGFHFQNAKIDASERSNETFPQPFSFDQPQAVEEFGINYHTVSLGFKVRYAFSEEPGFFVETGPETGVVTGLNYAYTEGNKTTSYDLDDEANRFNLGWDLGVGYDFDWTGDRWAVGFNGFHQLTPVLDDADIGLTPRGAQLFLRYEY